MNFLGLVLMLLVDTSASWVRMFIALGASVIISVFVGIYAATSQRGERIIIPVVDVLQTIPILAFFPFAIFVFVAVLPGYVGINAAVIFLIITSMIWNIIFGVYEAVKTIPNEFIELADIYHFDFWSKLRRVYLPASMPRIVEQSILSWAIGLFYLVTSEIFSTGNASYKVTYGIGSALPGLAAQGIVPYATAVIVFIAFVIATRFLFFRPWENYATRYMRSNGAGKSKLDFPRYEKLALDWIGQKIPRNRAVFDQEGFSIGAVKHTRRMQAAEEKTAGGGKFYPAIAVIIAFVVGYAIMSNGTLRGYEMTVLPALAASFVRVWLAFVVMLAITIPVCIYLIFVAKRSSNYMVFFQIVASVPATILLPALVFGLPHGEPVAFAVFILSGIWYVIFGIMASARTLSNSVFEIRKIFGVTGKNAWKNIYLKAILPGLITGSVTGIAAEWNASIVAEYYTSGGISGSTVISSVGTGIGKLLDTAIASGGLELMAIALLNLVVMIILIDTFVWKRYYKKIAKVYS
ncbi:MAG: ABC transporter permease subunit [Candidatus Micrarchaeaceae archaeon]